MSVRMCGYVYVICTYASKYICIHIYVPLYVSMYLCTFNIPTHVGGCQNYGPFWGPYYNTAPII